MNDFSWYAWFISMICFSYGYWVGRKDLREEQAKEKNQINPSPSKDINAKS